MDTVDSLARRALAGASDIADARQKLDLLTRSLREGLAAGETAEAGDLRKLAETTLAAFDLGAGPRIAVEGPAAVLAPEARQLVALALFDLASRSEQFGALSTPLGRVLLDWRARRGAGMRLTWREFGVAPGGAGRMRRGAGGPLLELLSQRFGGPLRVRATPSGLVAELTLPAGDVLLLGSAPPARALVAVTDATAALTLTALLFARGVGEVITARGTREAADVLASGDISLMVTDDPSLGAEAAGPRPPTILVVSSDAPTPDTGPFLRLPASATALTSAMADALCCAHSGRGASARGGRL